MVAVPGANEQYTCSTANCGNQANHLNFHCLKCQKVIALRQGIQRFRQFILKHKKQRNILENILVQKRSVTIKIQNKWSTRSQIRSIEVLRKVFDKDGIAYTKGRYRVTGQGIPSWFENIMTMERVLPCISRLYEKFTSRRALQCWKQLKLDFDQERAHIRFCHVLYLTVKRDYLANIAIVRNRVTFLWGNRQRSYGYETQNHPLRVLTTTIQKLRQGPSPYLWYKVARLRNRDRDSSIISLWNRLSVTQRNRISYRFHRYQHNWIIENSANDVTIYTTPFLLPRFIRKFMMMCILDTLE